MGPLGPRGFQRRGRRRGLVMGAAIANRRRRREEPEPPMPNSSSSSSSGLTAQLQELQNLKDQGLLTEKEYTAKKQQILGL